MSSQPKPIRINGMLAKRKKMDNYLFLWFLEISQLLWNSNRDLYYFYGYLYPPVKAEKPFTWSFELPSLMLLNNRLVSSFN